LLADTHKGRPYITRIRWFGDESRVGTGLVPVRFRVVGPTKGRLRPSQGFLQTPP